MLPNNYIDYSSIIKKNPPIYDFTLYTPAFNIETEDNDGWIKRDFYKMYNDVPKEMSDLNLEKIEHFF